MHATKVLACAFLASQATALLATFDTKNINLNNYMSASFPNFTVVYENQQSTENDIQAESGQYYIGGAAAGEGSAGPTQSNGTMLLNVHSKYGHLSSYYLGCYTPEAFVYGSYACNFTMTANCYNKNNTIVVFTLDTQYTKSDNTMQLVDLTGFYKYYAGLGYFTGTGSGARCLRYDFHAAPTTSGGSGQPFPVGFYLDSMTYNVTS